MKDKDLRALLKQPAVTSITSHMDKNGGISTLSPVVLLARLLILNKLNIQSVYNILLPTPHSLSSIDRFKWFGMLGLLLGKDVTVNLYVSGIDELKNVDSPYKNILKNIPEISVHSCLKIPADINFDVTFVCHNDATSNLVNDIKSANSKLNILTFWSETDWAVNAEVFKAYGIDLADPSYNEHSIDSAVESGSGWCQTYTTINSITEVEHANEAELITAEWLAAMYEHSSNIGHSNPYVMPGSDIKNLKLNNVVNQDYIYVIDNLICNTKNGFLYSYKQNEIRLVCPIHELAKAPHKKTSFLDKFIWAHQIKCIFHLRENEKARVNDRVNVAIHAYSKIANGPIGILLKGVIAELDKDDASAIAHYMNSAATYPSESYYRIGGVKHRLGLNEEAIEAWEIASKHKSAFGGYNAYVLSKEINYPNHTYQEHYDLLSVSANQGFEPAQAALSELCYGLGKVVECSKWLGKSAKNGNSDSAHNHVLILEKLLADGKATKFDLKLAQKKLQSLESNKHQKPMRGRT